MKPHLVAAHTLWKLEVCPGDSVIDATCGNGHDTVFLCRLGAKVFAFDCQQEALAKTGELVTQELGEYPDLWLERRCHSTFPDIIQPSSLKLAVYNLGYLPGGDKNITTKVTTTLASLKCALQLLATGGILSCTFYPGHEEGAREKEAVIAWAKELAQDKFLVEHRTWANRNRAPEILFITIM